jgi:hypothetical protein
MTSMSFKLDVSFDSGSDEFWEEIEKTNDFNQVTEAVKDLLDSCFYQNLDVQIRKITIER